MKDTKEMNGNTQGAGGMLATASGIFVSLLPYIEPVLRIASLVVGLTIGCITLYRMLKKKRHK